MASTTITRTPVRPISSELIELLPGVALALLMSGAVIYSLSISNWAPGLDILMPMGLPALLVGVVFARLRWLPGWLAHLLSAVLALAWGIQLLGSQMSERLSSWQDHATDLLIRAIIWGRVIGGGGRGEDILLFVAALCLLCWLLAYATAWLLFRRGWTWWAVVINAGLILINYTYVLPKPTGPFFVFLGAALLLIVYQNVMQRQALWDAQQMEYPDMLPVRFIWSAALVCGLLILITAALPGSVSIERASRTWEMVSAPFKTARERWEDLFSTIQAPPGAGSGSFTSGGASFGGARLLSDELVMYVRSTEYDYWRAVAFDKYTPTGWQNTVGEQARAALGAGTREQARTPFAPGESIPFGDVRGRLEVSQSFQLLADREDDLIMVGGTARRVSIPTRVEHNYLADSGRPNFDEKALIVSQNELRSGATYTVTALVSKADIESLRTSGDEYPDWVRERYLQLPPEVSQRTRDLADQVVSEAGAQTPYDRAIAIQEYLRSIPYTETIPAPPAGQDPVDWFLFDQQSGYCDYFASAMVVMLRSQGVPARWVRGYAGGEFDVERGIYVVRENVAHSWPEVYFPGFGWERFEPTPASYTTLPQRPLTSNFGDEGSLENGPLAAPLGENDPSRFEDLDEGLEQTGSGAGALGDAAQQPGDWSRPLGVIGAILGGLALLAIAVYARWRFELYGLSRISAAYAGMELLASWGGSGQPPHATPSEYAERLGVVLPEHRKTISQIATAYQSERYRRNLRANLPPEEAERDLRNALIRRIFTTTRFTNWVANKRME